MYKLAQNAADSAIEVRQLTKRYRHATHAAVEDLSFTIPRGTFFALLGPDGAGKTSTMRILSTLLAPSAGQVHLAGYDIVRDVAQVRRRIGLVFQQTSLDQQLTAEENMRLHAAFYGLYPFRASFAAMPSRYRQQVLLLAEMMGLADLLFKPVGSFSGGMQRRLEIVRSLLHNPEVLLMDEPTQGLDLESRRGLWHYLQQVRADRNMTIVLSTHNVEEAEQADLLCILKNGRQLCMGPPQQISTYFTTDLLLIDARDRVRLLHELQRLGLPFYEANNISIPLRHYTVQQILQAIHTPLYLIQICPAMLADAYLAVLKQ